MSRVHTFVRLRAPFKIELLYAPPVALTSRFKYRSVEAALVRAQDKGLSASVWSEGRLLATFDAATCKVEMYG